MSEDNGWGEYRKLILSELARLADKLERLDEKLSAIEATLTALTARNTDARWRAGTWIAVWGVIIAAGAAGVALLALLKH